MLYVGFAVSKLWCELPIFLEVLSFYLNNARILNVANTDHILRKIFFIFWENCSYIVIYVINPFLN